jgi:hypothetical protein
LELVATDPHPPVKASQHIQNPGHVIRRSRDEYMLTECRNHAWFIIELCETVKIVRFETDNYELYAGGAKLISVSVADKYSPHRRDWVHLGNFTLSGHKKQAERLGDLSATVFGRFVWVEVLANSHDEEEQHYCTMTSFRVYGVSEYEYLLEDSSHLEGELQQSTGSTSSSQLSFFHKKDDEAKVV